MSDDDLGPVHADVDPDVLLASAYVDGELAPDERAQAEASPQVLALAAQMRSMRATLAAAPAAVADQRDAAVHAALQTITAPSPAAAAAPVVALRRRRNWLGGLAAAAVVAVVGVGIAQLGSSSDDDDTSTALDNASTATTAPSASIAAAERSVEAADSVAGGVGEITGPAEADQGAEAQAPATPAAGLQQVDSPRELSEYAAGLTASPPASSESSDSSIVVTESTAPTCGYSSADTLGSISYLGSPALVVVDRGRDEVLALDLTSCAELGHVSAP